MTSAAGAAGSAGGDAGPAVNSGPAQGEGGGESFDASRAFAELRDGQARQQQMLEAMRGGSWQQQDQQADEYGGEYADDDVAEGYGDPEAEYDDGAQNGVDLDALAQDFGAHAADAAQQAVAPIAQEMQRQMADVRSELQWQNLAQEFPEMADKQVAENVLGTVRQLVDSGALPGGEKAFSPHVARLTYLALKGIEAAQAEEQAEPAPDAAFMEGGSGANPGGGSPDLGAEIVNAGAGQGRHILDFGG